MSSLRTDSAGVVPPGKPCRPPQSTSAAVGLSPSQARSGTALTLRMSGATRPSALLPLLSQLAATEMVPLRKVPSLSLKQGNHTDTVGGGAGARTLTPNSATARFSRTAGGARGGTGRGLAALIFASSLLIRPPYGTLRHPVTLLSAVETCFAAAGAASSRWLGQQALASVRTIPLQMAFLTTSMAFGTARALSTGGRGQQAFVAAVVTLLAVVNLALLPLVVLVGLEGTA